jgi:hypothetical protein
LSRILLKNMTFYSEGKQAAEFHRIRGRLLSGIEGVVRAAQGDGQIRPDKDAKMITRYIFLVFAGELRWWISDRKPDPRAGLANLKRLFELQISGLRPATTKSKRFAKRARRAATRH